MKMVITSEVENVDNWLANRVERHATILQFAENIVEYANAEVSNVVALTFDIVDETKMNELMQSCLLYTSPSPRDNRVSRMPSSA